jgi:hypothetical protein
MNQEIGTLGTERTNAIKVGIKEWKGKTYVDIRNWFKGTDNEWHPTQKGLFVAVEKISDLITMIEKAEAILKTPVKK